MTVFSIVDTLKSHVSDVRDSGEPGGVHFSHVETQRRGIRHHALNPKIVSQHVGFGWKKNKKMLLPEAHSYYNSVLDNRWQFSNQNKQRKVDCGSSAVWLTPPVSCHMLRQFFFLQRVSEARHVGFL